MLGAHVAGATLAATPERLWSEIGPVLAVMSAELLDVELAPPVVDGPGLECGNPITPREAERAPLTPLQEPYIE
jgi:hypothetical protein